MRTESVLRGDIATRAVDLIARVAKARKIAGMKYCRILGPF